MTANRPNARGVTLSGRQYTQQAPRTGREWTWSLPVNRVDILRELEALEQGVYGLAPWRWYDPWAAALNMLPPNAAVPGLALDLEDVVGGVAVTGDPMVLSDGTGRCVFFRAGVIDQLAAPARRSDVDPVPVLAERPYTASAYGLATDGDGWAVSLVWVDRDGAELNRDDGPIIGPSPDVERADVTATPPADAAGVYVLVETGSVDVTGSVTGVGVEVTALQLTETNRPVNWHPGLGIPHVSIPGGFTMQLRRLPRPDEDLTCRPGNLRSLELTVVEVG